MRSIILYMPSKAAAKTSLTVGNVSTIFNRLQTGKIKPIEERNAFRKNKLTEE
jgi:hypothetical protein